MTRREVVERGEEFVAALLVEGPRLPGVGVEMGGVTAAHAGIVLRGIHQARCMALAAQGLVDPEDRDEQPVGPEVAQQAAERFALLPFRKMVQG